MAAVGEDERRAEAELELELEAAAILCDLKRILRARDRRRRRRQQKRGEARVIPSWGRRRLRSALEKDAKPSAAERDGAASPDTPLAFRVPEEEEEEEEDKKARAQAEWVQEQRVVVASLSREKADLLKQIEEYRARLLSSRSANESLKQLHKVRQQEQQARKTQALALPLRHIPNPRRHPLPALGLDLNEPADEAAARAAAAQQQWYWQVQLQQQQKAAVTAEARRRRLEVLRAKLASSSWSRTPRRRMR